MRSTLDFLDNVEGRLEGTLAVGYKDADIDDSAVTFLLSTSDGEGVKMGPVTVNYLYGTFTGGSQTPELYGAMGFKASLPAPASGELVVDQADFTYSGSKKELKPTAYPETKFSGWMPSSKVAFEIKKSR